jgi:3-oxoacyl-[acyl-carrier protein] reductase
MELGLKGKKAIVCASSRGLGRGCAEALLKEGVSVVINGTNKDTVAKTADEISNQADADVTTVVANLDQPEGRLALLEACPEPDILVNNNGGPPPGNFRDWGQAEWDAGLTANLIAPVELIKATVDGMVDRGFGRIVNITSIAVQMPFPGLAMSSAARSGLTAFVASVCREVASKNVTINNLQPGIFDTDRAQTGFKGAAKATGRTVEEARAGLIGNIPVGRLGTTDEFGHACAFLCSAYSGFITGQSLLLDGGHFSANF